MQVVHHFTPPHIHTTWLNQLPNTEGSHFQGVADDPFLVLKFKFFLIVHNVY